jgi:hypothetical protein
MTVARIHGARSYRDLGLLAKLTLVFVYVLDFLVAAFVLILLSKRTSGGYAASSFFGLLFFLLILVFTGIFGETFFSAFWSPFRWCARRVGSLASVFPAMVTYGVRSSGWLVLLKMIMGLESYRFEIPLVEQYPSGVGKEFVRYENMPSGAEQRAVDKRSAWISRHLGGVSQTFSKLAVTAADITELLRTVEEDQTLVHAAYYTDDECIARVADWIACRG